MKLKNIFPVIICISVGFFMSAFMFKQYNTTKTLPAINTKSTLTFLQIGVYSSKESMEQNLENIKTYIVEEENGLYYAYVGIIKEEENLKKITGYFNKKQYIIYKKQKEVSNEAFLNILEQYELMLKEISSDEEIKTIIEQIITQYEELVLNEQN